MKTLILAMLVLVLCSCASSPPKPQTTTPDPAAVVQHILDAGFRLYVAACLPDPLKGTEAVCGVALQPRDPSMTPLSFAVDIAQRLYRGACLPTPAPGLELECGEITRNLGPVLAPQDPASAESPSVIVK